MRKETKMSKKLKIQFWKAEKALAMQILEQEGLSERSSIAGFVHIYCSPSWGDDFVFLRGSEKEDDLDVLTKRFPSNAERDEYLQKAVNAITDELFTGEGELKIGEICEVRDDKDKQWKKRKLVAILPEKYDERFIVEMEDHPTEVGSWRYARPITKRTEPTIEECGNVVTYTWEEK